MKKRFLTLILIVAMVIQQGFPILTHALPSENQTAKASEILTLKNVSENKTEENNENDDQLINFMAKISLSFPITKDGKIDEDIYKSFHIYLENSSDKNVKEAHSHTHLSMSLINENEVTFTAQNVASGQYVLNIETDHYYRKFKQEIVIEEGNLHTVYLSDSYVMNQNNGDKTYGILAIGDLNNDGSINQNDVDRLKSHMGQSKETSIDFETNYDLNQDGLIDIVDMSIMAYNYNINEDVKGVVTQSLLSNQVTVLDNTQNAVVQGERPLDTIMEEKEEPISLKPVKDGNISEENPIKIEMDFKNTETKIEGIIIKAPQDTGPTNGSIEVETADSKILSIPITQVSKARSGHSAIRKADGTIEVNLGEQVAIKKVTIVVTASATSTDLTEIAKVEFLNDMENRIPEPELNIPQNIQVSGKGKELNVKWDEEVNVTGYEVRVYAKNKEGKRVPEKGYNTYKSGINELKIEEFSGGLKDKVTALWTYYVSVKSTNGTWSSPYSLAVEHYQKSAGIPAAPDNVKVNGKYRQLDVSWKDMEETEYYTLGYRIKNSNDEYTEIHNIQTNSYSILNLKDNTEYEIYVYGWNKDDNDNPRHGPKSLPAIGKTILDIPEFSKYKMINTPNKEGGLSSHIIKVESIATPNPGGPGGIDLSQYPDGVYKDEYLVDGDYTTYMHTNKGYPNGAEVTFDQEYNFKEIIMTNRLEEQYKDGLGYSQVDLEFYNGNNQLVKTFNKSDIQLTSLHPTGRNSIRFTLPTPVKAQKVVLKLSKYGAGELTVSELNFFEYDSLEDDVYNLFDDDMHITLKQDTTEEKIDALKARLEIKDEISNEYHPKKVLLNDELEYARQLLNDKEAKQDLINVNPDITLQNTDASLMKGGLSGLQPLGYVASAKGKLNVYVGQKGKQVGEEVNAKLVFTQYHAESSAWKSGEIALKQGVNEIEVPNISSLDFEKGGSIYVQHSNTQNIKNNPIQIRISGATKIPTLDLHRTIGEERYQINETEFKTEIRRYVTELKTYVENLEVHHASHQQTVGKDYDIRNCFLNTTEISLDNVLMSVAASEIYAGIKRNNNDSIEALTQNMYDNVVAMNQLVELFYKQRGFNPLLTNGKHGIPTGRFNIRYQRMFAGAFMYAGGSHLGIEFDSIKGVTSGEPVVSDENGKYKSGSLFGWGIAHEMGHNADVSGVTMAEVTNNIWSQFSMTKDTKDSTRIPYTSVYEKVTSNTVGRSNDVFTQLGMFWQLHLAYDKNFTHFNYYKDKFSTENYNNMLNGEFFARYYAIRRDYSLAPNNGVAYTNSSSFEQNVMRTASAAAKKDLTDFFKAWGYIADEQTLKYMQQFEKETRQIQYLNDGAREYTLNKGTSLINSQTQINASLTQGTGVDAKKVTLTMSLPQISQLDGILGYEIIRNNQPVAFVEVAKDENNNYLNETVYTDLIGSENNRVMTYSIKAYDKYLNVSKTYTFEPIKITHDGELPRDQWTVTSNAISSAGVLNLYDTKENKNLVVGTSYKDVVTNQLVQYTLDMDVNYLDSETGELNSTVSGANVVLDGNVATEFRGQGTSNRGVYIDLNLNATEKIVGLKYKNHSALANQPYEIWVSSNGVNYNKVEFITEKDPNSGYTIAYFKGKDKNLRGIDVTNVRFVSPWDKFEISAAELSLVGQTGDNIDLETDLIGLLDKDYQLDQNNKIPAGSFVVMGQYTGNAAYNVVKLFNQNHMMHDQSISNQLNSIVNGYQVFFASMPDMGSIVNVKNGSWIFWLEPLGNNQFGLKGAGVNGEDVVVEIPKKLYAQLYRVDNALTLENERFVSDSFMIDVPSTLPTISLTNDNTQINLAVLKETSFINNEIISLPKNEENEIVVQDDQNLKEENNQEVNSETNEETSLENEDQTVEKIN